MGNCTAICTGIRILCRRSGFLSYRDSYRTEIRFAANRMGIRTGNRIRVEGPQSLQWQRRHKREEREKEGKSGRNMLLWIAQTVMRLRDAFMCPGIGIEKVYLFTRCDVVSTWSSKHFSFSSSSSSSSSSPDGSNINIAFLRFFFLFSFCQNVKF
jgi:hypothetical protein